ncbi:MAG: cytochrome c oxidase subunit II [Bowdeniella nasicola]|nr:cytochrome c oxidase subunit II [Bowdeniella nasicola]
MRTKLHTVRRRPWRLGALAAASALALAGCSADQLATGYLPSKPGLTDKTESIINLWNGAWIAGLAVGVLVWGLIIWSIIVYRKRKDDHELPVQLQYHIPLELMYTIIPVIMVGVLFYNTVRVTDNLWDTSGEADTHISVYGKQWSWDFNYLDEGVYYSGDRITLTGKEGDRDKLPILYLPVNETVEFQLHSRDVQHSFWIPAFLTKLDMVPGELRVFHVTPQETGTFVGKCAELCGEYHAEMLFQVKVVERDEYDAAMQELRDAGNVGERGEEFDRTYTPGGTY